MMRNVPNVNKFVGKKVSRLCARKPADNINSRFCKCKQPLHEMFGEFQEAINKISC